MDCVLLEGEREGGRERGREGERERGRVSITPHSTTHSTAHDAFPPSPYRREAKMIPIASDMHVIRHPSAAKLDSCLFSEYLPCSVYRAYIGGLGGV